MKPYLLSENNLKSIRSTAFDLAVKLGKWILTMHMTDPARLMKMGDQCRNAGKRWSV